MNNVRLDLAFRYGWLNDDKVSIAVNKVHEWNELAPNYVN